MAGAHTNTMHTRTDTTTTARKNIRFCFRQISLVFFCTKYFQIVRCSLDGRMSTLTESWINYYFPLNWGKLKLKKNKYYVYVLWCCDDEPKTKCELVGNEKNKKIRAVRERETKSTFKLDLIIFSFPLVRSFSLVHAIFFFEHIKK